MAAALAVATSAGLIAAPSIASATPQESIPVQLIAMNDFHGRITPQGPAPEKGAGDGTLATAPGKDGKWGGADDTVFSVGGAAHIAANVDRLQESFRTDHDGEPTSLFVGAGDLVSASPFESSVYKDEPTIEVLNAMGLDMSSVGNHEFDRGTEELRRISADTDNSFTDDVVACPETLDGEPFVVGTDGCFGNGHDHDFEGAQFPYLAANVVSRETGETILPPYEVVEVGGGQRMALIGVVTDTTPTIVSPHGVDDVRFIDEATAVNRLVPQLIRQGIKAIGVLVHEGATVTDPNAAPFLNNCAGLKGDLVDINDNMHDQVDLIVSAHTHAAYNCMLPSPDGTPRLVTSAGFYGRELSDIRLTIKHNGDVDRSAVYRATNVPVTRDVIDTDVQEIVDYWNGRADVTGNIKVGEVTETLDGPNGSTERHLEWPLTNLIADTQLWALQQDPAAADPVAGAPEIAFMNPGGIRTDILMDAEGVVTYREVFNVQPFSNTVNAMNLSGAEIKQVLEQQFAAPSTTVGRTSQLVLGVAGGVTYTYDASLPYGSKIAPCSLQLNGQPIVADQEYRVVANSFLASPGDGFTAFGGASSMYVGPMDADASVNYFQKFSPVSAPDLGRFPASTSWSC
jgi:5'-nucleotidase